VIVQNHGVPRFAAAFFILIAGNMPSHSTPTDLKREEHSTPTGFSDNILNGLGAMPR
jgi:hypothetical protein